MFGKKPQQYDELYLGLREEMINNKIDFTPDEVAKVSAALIDVPTMVNVTTIACAFDGTVSVYFSTGGGRLGLGHKYKSICDEGMCFLLSASDVLEKLDKLEKADKIPPPEGKKTLIYLAATDGVFRAEYDMKHLYRENPTMHFLDFLVQRLLFVIRRQVKI